MSSLDNNNTADAENPPELEKSIETQLFQGEEKEVPIPVNAKPKEAMAGATENKDPPQPPASSSPHEPGDANDKNEATATSGLRQRRKGLGRKRLSQQELIERRVDANNHHGLLKENGLETYFPDPDIDNSTLVENFAWFAEFTSVHGIYYAFERGHFEKWKLRLWSLLVLACTAALLWTLTDMVQGFLLFKNNSSTETVIPPSLEFPQITICNTNPFSVSLQQETGITEPTNEEELAAISQPLEDFILYSAFNNFAIADEITEETWIPTITSRGRCFTYNNTNLSVVQPGPHAGLEVWAWLDQENYLEDTFDAGLYVFVEQTGNTMISDQSKQTLVPAGVSAFLDLEKVVHERTTKAPWSTCRSKAPEYTNAICRAECVNNATRNNCGCRRYGDPNTTLPYCTYGNESFVPVGCSLVIDDNILRNCDCTQPPCSEEIFYVYFSAASLGQPYLKKFRRDLMDRIISSKNATTGNNNNQSTTIGIGRMEDNLVRLRVNFDTIRYEKTTESPDKLVGALISDMGGQMGFFMGISIISIIELFGELLLLRLLPRLWGDYRLYGIGQRRNRKDLGKVY